MIASAVHAPNGEEVECYRRNIIFDGPRFEISLQVSYSETPGTYIVKAEYPVTGMKAQTRLGVVLGS